MATDKHYFVEKDRNDEYMVIAAQASRASATAGTEKEAIRLARKFNPGNHPDVSRVRKRKLASQTGGVRHTEANVDRSSVKNVRCYQ